MYQHAKEAARGGDSYKCNLIRKLQREGKAIQYRVVFATPDEREAYAYEIFEIGRIGLKSLTNVKPGGWTRAEHDHVFASNVPHAQLNYARYSQLLDAHGVKPGDRPSLLRNWAQWRVMRLHELYNEAWGYVHEDAMRLIEKEINIVETYTARQLSFAALERHRNRYNEWKEILD